MERKEADRLFRRYLPMARAIARKYATRTGRDYSELVDEAEGILAEVCCEWDSRHHFDPTKSKESSYCYQLLDHKLFDKVYRGGKGKNTRTFSTLQPDARLFDLPAKRNRIGELLTMLGDDARTLVNTILNAPGDLADDMQVATRSWARINLRTYFAQQGWTPERLESAWAEVKECL